MSKDNEYVIPSKSENEQSGDSNQGPSESNEWDFGKKAASFASGIITALCVWRMLYAVVWQIPLSFIISHPDWVGMTVATVYLTVLGWSGTRTIRALRKRASSEENDPKKE